MKEQKCHLPAGTLLQGDKYRIVRFINSGGFGCTYEAMHIRLKKRVAIKEFFAKDFCNRDETTSRVTVGVTSKQRAFEKLRSKFLDEACVLSDFQHRGIVHVSGVFEENGTAYYVMDYIDGQSLADLVKREGPLSEARALGYIRQVCEALQYVHSRNRLHLDIKPDNIMVDEADHAVLIDFGASKLYDEESGENKSALLGHTEGYAPPEQSNHDVRKFLPATDLYALGVTLYKLLTGDTPPAASDRSSGEELRPLPSDVSAATRAAVFAAMEMNKLKRPQSVEAFLAILDGDDASEPEVTIIDVGGESGREDWRQKVVIEDGRPEKTETEKKAEHGKPAQPADDKLPVWKYVAIVVSVVVVLIGLLMFGWGMAVWTGVVFFGILVWKKLRHREKISVKTFFENNGHDYVDLGLSVKWATCNIGAVSPSDYGNYYAWGEVFPKSEYTEANSATLGKKIGNIADDSRHDVARSNWGGSWRLPTRYELDELIYGCIWTWTTMDGKKGYKVTGKNGNSIFLPAAGRRRWTSIILAGVYGGYWSSTSNEDNDVAYDLDFKNGNYNGNWGDRYYGLPIRSVLA